MKFLIALTLVLAMGFAVANADTYSSKYDSLDIDEILHSDRLFKNYYKCLIGEGSCTPDARDLKAVLPDALQTECAKCTGTQKEKGEKVINNIIEKRPEEWKVLQAKYDPQNLYISRYRSLKG